MGLFSKLRAAPAPDTSLAKAVLMPAVLTMISDGDIGDGELAQLGNICGFSPIFANVDGPKLKALIQEVITDLTSKDLEQVTQTAKSQLTMEMRETAILFAMRIALADGHVDDNEQRALVGLGERFEIPENKFVIMLDVIAMLQRRPAMAA